MSSALVCGDNWSGCLIEELVPSLPGELGSSLYRGRELTNMRLVWLLPLAQRGAELETGAGGEFVRRVANAASRCDHPGLCSLLELRGGEQPAALWLREEGENLRERLRRGPLSPLEALHLVRDAALALAPLHRLGEAHGGLCPALLALTPDRRTVVLAPGLRPAVSGEDRTAAGQGSSEGDVALDKNPQSTPVEYRSPEVRADLPARHRAATDVWSLGAILAESVFGSWPQLDAEEKAAGEVTGLIERCLRAVPGERFADADELARAVDEVARQLRTRSVARSPTVPPTAVVSPVSTRNAGVFAEPTSNLAIGGSPVLGWLDERRQKLAEESRENRSGQSQPRSRWPLMPALLTVLSVVVIALWLWLR